MTDGRKAGLNALPLIRKGTCIKTIGPKISIGEREHGLDFLGICQGYSCFIEKGIDGIITVIPMPIAGIMRNGNVLFELPYRKGGLKRTPSHTKITTV